MFEALNRALVYLRLGLAIIPDLIDLIKKIEQQISLPGNGPEKLAFLVELTAQAWELVPEDLRKALGLETVQKFVTKVAGIVVSFLNRMGVFQSSKS